MAATITNIGHIKNDSNLVSPLNAILEAAQDIQQGIVSPDKAVVIMLTTKDGEYTYN